MFGQWSRRSPFPTKVLGLLKRRSNDIQMIKSGFYFKKERSNKIISEEENTRWFKYDRDKLWLVYTQIVPVIFEPPCIWPKKEEERYAVSLRAVFLQLCWHQVNLCQTLSLWCKKNYLLNSIYIFFSVKKCSADWQLMSNYVVSVQFSIWKIW